MKGKFLNLSIFVLSLICLFISIKLFWNMGIYVDEANTSPDVVLGGNLWLIADWARLCILAVISVLSGASLFNKNYK